MITLSKEMHFSNAPSPIRVVEDGKLTVFSALQPSNPVMHSNDFGKVIVMMSERIENAINRQDVREFYRMINEISAQHLGAIQVLGFILGSIIGALQLL